MAIVKGEGAVLEEGKFGTFHCNWFFSCYIYKAHHAVNFAIARRSYQIGYNSLRCGEMGEKVRKSLNLD